MKRLIIVAGPTAVGKTALCVELAKILNTEIISADSRQFYSELNIGTAKPTIQEMQGVPHHFVGSHTITNHYSVGDYERDALILIEQLFQKYDNLILTGGSGMFLKVICEGIDPMPNAPLALRETLESRAKNEGIEILFDELKALDPSYANVVDIKNHQRIVRALEVCLDTGKPFSSFRIKQKVERNFEIIKFCLNRDREDLYERINLRMDLMLENGLLEEAKSLTSFKNHNALQTVGYKEVFDYFDEKCSFEEMVTMLKQNSRRYAKRQLTWFRNQDQYQWLMMNDNPLEKILKALNLDNQRDR